MYPYTALPENLAAFCAVLRREYGFHSGPGELIDAARALAVTSLADVSTLRHMLRPILSTTAGEAAAFDDAFDRFFLRGAAPHLESPPLSGAQTRETAGSAPRRDRPRHSEPLSPQTSPDSGGDDGIIDTVGGSDDEHEGKPEILRASYSPLDGEGAAPDLLPPDRAWRDAAAALVQRLHAGLSRRWLPAPHGERFDMRRTLRGSLHTAGEMVVPRWRARPHRRPKFVLLIDGSRSMGARATPPLRIAVALASVTGHVEAFTFSTEIGRITRDVRRAASGRPQRLHHLRHAWGGGTTIGACLGEFLRVFGARLLGREVVLVIASDGLDVGAPATLRDAMATLRRLSAAIIWLNPLVDTPDYEPTALGMRTALPYVTSLTWVEHAAALLKLSRTIRVRR